MSVMDWVRLGFYVIEDVLLISDRDPDQAGAPPAQTEVTG